MKAPALISWNKNDNKCWIYLNHTKGIMLINTHTWCSEVLPAISIGRVEHCCLLSPSDCAHYGWGVLQHRSTLWCTHEYEQEQEQRVQWWRCFNKVCCKMYWFISLKKKNLPKQDSKATSQIMLDHWGTVAVYRFILDWDWKTFRKC